MKKWITGLYILAINFNLLAQDQLTKVEYAYPHWSVNDLIVFQTNLFGTWDLFTMTPDGSNKKPLLRDEHNNITPQFSPDGSKITFVSDRDGDNDVYIINLKGNTIDKLTHNNYQDYHPSWSPDGARITFGSGPSEDKVEIYEIELSTRKIKQITENKYFDSFSSYSPDGSKICWIKWMENENGDLFLYDIEKGEEERLTETEYFEGYPSWSKNGRYIYYAFQNPDTKAYDIGRIDLENRKRESVFKSEMNDARPQESPNGGMLIFNREDKNGLYIHTISLGSNN